MVFKKLKEKRRVKKQLEELKNAVEITNLQIELAQNEALLKIAKQKKKIDYIG